VEFSLDGAPAGRDADPIDGFLVELDTTKLPNGLHTLGITPLGGEGQVLTELRHSILVQN
jgi:hypothetical protein